MWNAVDHDRAPATFSRVQIVIVAEQAHLPDIGGSAGLPFGCVVDLGPGSGLGAAREAAAQIAGLQRIPLPEGRDSAESSVAEDAARVIEHNRYDTGVRCHLQRLVDAE